MPAKPRKLSDLSDDELEAERRRRKKANRPQYVEVHRMTEEQYQRLLKSQGVDDDEDDDDDSDDDEGTDDEGGKGRYFGS